MGMGMMNPMGMAAPMAGMGALYPAMQMAPNMMSFSHMNAMTNPYLGGPLQGNPYLQGMPFAAPAWGMPQQAQQMPFSFPMMAPQPALQPAPQQAFPFPMMPAQPQAAAQPAAPATAYPAWPMMPPSQVAPAAAPAASQQPPAQAPQAQGSTASGTAPMYFDPAVWLNMMTNPQPAAPEAK
jgi:hypothetical protein